MVIQHFLGKEKAGGSSPPGGSIPVLCGAREILPVLELL